MGITVVGLGPGDPLHLTREAWQVLSAAKEVWLRTRRHPTLPGLPGHLTIHSFDHLYESSPDFDQVYRAIAQEVLRLGQRPQGVVYAVPGHPLVGEATVQQLLAGAEENRIPVRIVEGLSFVEPALTALGLDGLDGLQIHDGIELASLHHPLLNPDLPALVAQVYSRPLAAELKLTLMNQYPDDHPVVLIHSAGLPQQRLIRLPLWELDRREVDHLTTLYIPPLPGVSSLPGFQDTVAHLRSPEGCRWDQAQTHESLRSDLLEEAYEAVAAIDEGDMAKLCQELGDLLLGILLHVQIATEEGDFRMGDVIAGVDAKIKHRHPHVWGDRTVEGEKELLAQWEDLKREERNGQGSLLDGIPRILPALQAAYAYGDRAARVGFDWPDPSQVAEKVREELAEVESARSPQEVEDELGDLLFAVVNWARHLGVEPESALRRANERFARRFRALEDLARQRGLDLYKMSLEEMDRLWEEVKGAGEQGSKGAGS